MKEILDITNIIVAITMSLCFVFMVKLDTKSNTLKITYFSVALMAVVGLANKLSCDYMLISWAFASVFFALGWYRFYIKHKFFFQFAKYERGAALAIYDTDEKGTIKWINNEACRMLGYSKEHLIGKSAEDLVKDNKSPSFIKAKQDAYKELAEFGITEVAFDYVKSDGNIIRLKSIIYPVKENGHLKHFIGVTVRV